MNSSIPIPKEMVQELHCSPGKIRTQRLNREELTSEAQERSKQQPLLQRIIKSLSKNDKKFREVLISREGLETRVVMLVDGVLESLELEHIHEQNLVGAIFKGRIQNLEPGLKAAFVITGEEKNAFLHYWDMLPAANDSFEIVSQGSQHSHITLEDIPSMYPVGTEILVQVTKAQIGSKGPRVTTNISLPGRYLVLTPFNDQCGISRKIEEPKERERLKEMLRRLAIPEGMGIILRTASQGKKLKHFVRDLSILLKEWDEITTKSKANDDPGLLYREPDLVGRAVRDFLTDEVDRIVTDCPLVYARIIHDINEYAPRLRGRIRHYEGDAPIFEHFNVERQIQETFCKRVSLPSGGEIVIEETEALIAIDVNTGGHRLQNEENKNFILQVNLEAASEIARQLRLRNLGGLVIIDFIDMKNRLDQRRVYEVMQELMDQNSAKFQILPISTLGIMQMTRQRHSQSLAREMRTACPYCSGSGTVKSARTMDAIIQRKLLHVLKQLRQTTAGEPITLRVLLHPEVLRCMKNSTRSSLTEIEQKFAAQLFFHADPIIHMENFKILDGSTGEEVLLS